VVKIQKNSLKIFLAVFITLLIGLTGGFLISKKIKFPAKKTTVSVFKDKYLAFLFEVYETIKVNYWEKITDEQLTNLFILGTEKVTGKPQVNKPKDKPELQKLLTSVLKDQDSEQKKKEFTSQLANIVLANLQPFGRSRLYSQKEEIALKNNVENKNPEVDQYQVLNVKKDASMEEINQTYKTQAEKLTNDKSPEAQQKLAQINNAYQTLADQNTRKVYDQSGIEATMVNKILAKNILYFHIDKFSPTTIQELLNISEKYKNIKDLNYLIIDLRGNVGGAIDGLPYFLGPFIGNDQYAYQFYQQGNKEDFKTKTDWFPGLVQYKQTVILIDSETQSSAEVMAAVLKKYNVGVLFGTPTKGWGTVEKVFELKQQIDPLEKYSVFLVHHLTLREDGQPIEGRGVDPSVNIQDPAWKNQLFTYLHNEQLISEIEKIVKTP